MARKNTFLSKQALVNHLNNLGDVSRFLALQLVTKGYVAIEKVKTGKRGKPAHVFVLTGKGRGYIALSKNWGGKARVTAAIVEATESAPEMAEAA